MRKVLVAALLVSAPSLAVAQPLGTSFTYQGRLTDGGNPASGPYDLRIAMFDAPSGGAQVGPTLTRDDVVVTNGLFVLTLDFGTAFAGNRRWLEIGVRPGASAGGFTTLAGRQELTPSPYAVFSSAAPWGGIAGKPAGFADDTDDDVLGSLACANGQVAKRAGGAWACAADADSGGDITAVNVGGGLTGGGTSGSVTLGVSFGASGSATAVARADHDHTNQTWVGATPTQPLFRVTNVGQGPGFSDGIWGQADAAGQARGIVGYATAASGQNMGVWGQADSTNGRGVFGLAASGSGVTYGVYGEAASTDGYGGYFTGRLAAAGTLIVGGGTPIAKVLSTTWHFLGTTVPPGAGGTILTVPLPGAVAGDAVTMSFGGQNPWPCVWNPEVFQDQVRTWFTDASTTSACVFPETTIRFTVIHF